jgi:dienelactone hydrolase
VVSMTMALEWLHSHLVRRPAFAARTVPPSVDVLVARGENDAQVFASDFDALRSAFGKAPRRLTAASYPGLNHCFSPGTNDDPRSCADPSRGIADAVTRDVIAFLVVSLAARGAIVQ